MNTMAEAPSFFASVAASDRQRRALATLGIAVAGGMVTQALFWKTRIGLNLLVLDVALAGAFLAVFPRRSIPMAAWGAALASLMFGLSIVRFASPWTMAFALPTNVAVLAALPLLLTKSVSLSEIGGVPLRLLTSLRHAPRAAAAVRGIPRVAAGAHGGTVVRALSRGALLGVPTASIFALLLSSDGDFRQAVCQLVDQCANGILFATLSAMTSAGYLLVHALHAPMAGAPREATASILEPEPYRHRADAPTSSSTARGPLVTPATWAMVVGQVAVVFAIFVSANIRHMFGGAAFVRSPASDTYAAYLHSGFALLLCATLLSVGLVLVGHVLLARDGLPGQKVPGGVLLMSLEILLLTLTSITLASCWQRLCVYEDAYGASRLRLAVAVAEYAILGLLVLTAVKTVFRQWRSYGSAVVIFMVAVALVASHFNGDAYVARRNLNRAAAGRWLDQDYLASLSADARSALNHPVVRSDSSLSARLKESFCTARSGDWREYRGIGRCEP